MGSNNDSKRTSSFAEKELGTLNDPSHSVIDIPALSVQETISSSQNSQTPERQSSAVELSQSKLAQSVDSAFERQKPRLRDRGYSLRRQLFHKNPLRIPAATAEFLSGEQSTHSIVNNDNSQPTETGAVSQQDQSFTMSDKEYKQHIRFSEKNRRSTNAFGFSFFTPKLKRSNSDETLPPYSIWETKKKNALRAFIADTYRGIVNRFWKRCFENDATVGRIITIDLSKSGKEHSSSMFVDNTVKSSRYGLLNFLPLQLYFQFSKLANFYFLLVGTLQMIPGMSTTGSYTTIVPLIFFVLLSIAREGYDDYRRHRQDVAENRSMTNLLISDAFSSATVAPTRWCDVQVGDIVVLKDGDWVPADLFLLYTRGPDNRAYVETMALDGETNLKPRDPIPQISSKFSTYDEINKFKATVICEKPNPDLYKFVGTVKYGTENYPLTNAQILYRGTVLKMSSLAYGLVIFTGEDTKIRLNASRNIRAKAPSLQRYANKVVIVTVFVVFFIAGLCTLLFKYWETKTMSISFYLSYTNVPIYQIITSFIIIFNTMIPLSLYVSMEIIKLFQMYLLQSDLDMYHEQSDTPAEARTSTINEELGQVSYMFSDKTGTLTDNIMLFRKMAVAGYSFLHDADIKREVKTQRIINMKRRVNKKKRSGEKSPKLHRSLSISGFGSRDWPYGSHKRKEFFAKLLDGSAHYHTERSYFDHLQTDSCQRQFATTWRSTAVPTKEQPSLTTTDLLSYISHHPHTVFARRVRIFLLNIALCHTCLIDSNENTHADSDITYRSASPDELALVNAAKELGYIVTNRDSQTITMRIKSTVENNSVTDEQYQILDVLEFSSERKRMSIILRLPNGKICLFCKGADTVIAPRLRLSELALKKAQQVERQASIRRSVEATLAAQQKKTLDKAARSSLTLSRPSIAGGRMDAFHHLDEWLRLRSEAIAGLPVSPIIVDDCSRMNSLRHSFALGEAQSPVDICSADELIDDAVASDDARVFESSYMQIDEFAREGLRTLLHAHRYLSQQQYDQWKLVYAEAKTNLVDRQIRMDRACEMIEQCLEISGCTAIEDKLQLGVPETIDKLRRAGVKLWMLTGDKRETAINVGHACRLIKDYSTTFVLESKDPEELLRVMHDARSRLKEDTTSHSVVVVDGSTLNCLEQHIIAFAHFIELVIRVSSVVVCRASPSQKATMVRAIRRRLKNITTLAIGDGANDIAMIQEAHVGIGITGKEGLQAARSSDYSIAQFRFLIKLLFVHGRWNYIRISKYMLLTFWKEMLFYLQQGFFQTYTRYTGTSLMEPWSLSMFNTLFTSLPVIVIGIIEKDLAASTLVAVPELYANGPRNLAFNVKKYLGWMLLAVAQACTVFYFMYFAFASTDVSQTGIWASGFLNYTICMSVIAIKSVFMEMHNWSLVNVLCIVITFVGWAIWNASLNSIYALNSIYHLRNNLENILSISSWWFALFGAIISALLIDLGVTMFRKILAPQDTDVFQELERDPLIKVRFLAESALEMPRSPSCHNNVQRHSTFCPPDEDVNMEECGYATDSTLRCAKQDSNCQDHLDRKELAREVDLDQSELSFPSSSDGTACVKHRHSEKR